jgi:hypothetical protein
MHSNHSLEMNEIIVCQFRTNNNNRYIYPRIQLGFNSLMFVQFGCYIHCRFIHVSPNRI